MMRENALPPDLLDRIRDTIATVPRPAWQLRQRQTVNRVMPLPSGRDGSAVAELGPFLCRRGVRDLMGYAAGRSDGARSSQMRIRAESEGAQAGNAATGG